MWSSYLYHAKGECYSIHTNCNEREKETKRKKTTRAQTDLILRNNCSGVEVFLLTILRLPNFRKMSTALRFSLLGDSNVRRNITKNTLRASPLVKSCQVICCGGLEVFASSLESVRSESNVCILSCVTNFLTCCDGPSSISQRIEPVLQEIRAALNQACEANPDRGYMLSPPMYRSCPLWYREGLPEILTLFSSIMIQERPTNLHLLSSFATPEYDQDGIHLTPYSGMEFILHLFDNSQNILENLDTDLEEVATRTTESVRVLEDRVVALEQDHRRLHRVVDHKIAVDAELSDMVKNESFEDCFVLEGTDRIPDEIFGKAWQDQALKDSQKVIKVTFTFLSLYVLSISLTMRF